MSELVSEGWLTVEQHLPEIQQEAKKRTAELLGGIALRDVSVNFVTESIEQDNSNPTTLMALTHAAALGDTEAIKSVDNNVATDVAERLFKAGHQTEIFFDYNQATGSLEQNGIALNNISLNTLNHSYFEGVMKQRTESELHNTSVFEELAKTGILEEYNAVVFSHTPEDESVKDEYGFFKDTDTLSIQVLSQITQDKYSLESAFVAGKTTPDGERFDLENVSSVLASHNIEIDKINPERLLQYVVLIPKEDMQLGVASIVEEYDNVSGTFYGQAVERKDYEKYAQECSERDFSEITEKITNQLIAEAHTFKRPMDAVIRLDELSGKYGVKYAVENDDVNEAVFGETAAPLIQTARLHYAQGNVDAANNYTMMAQENEDSSSCPFKKAMNSIEGIDGLDNTEQGNNDSEASGERKMTCPFCKEETKGDPCADSITCTKCSASTKCSQQENERRAQKYKDKKAQEEKITKHNMVVKNERLAKTA